MKVLPRHLPTVLEEDELEAYELEVQHYNCNSKLPNVTIGTKIDDWWRLNREKYPTIWKCVQAVLGCFHGPAVESSFSIMGNVITAQTSSIKICTFSAIQTVKYKLQAANQSAVQYFRRKDVTHDPVPQALVKNMKTAYKRYKNELDEIKTAEEAKRTKMNLKKKSVVAKKKARELNMLAAQKAHRTHKEEMKKKYTAKPKSKTNRTLKRKLQN